MTGLIGPNGSGKSTTIDCISGFQRPDGGRVVLAGRDITAARPQDIARAGLMRTFQNVRVYEQLSVLDNLTIASAQFDQAGWFDELLRTRRYRAAVEAAEMRARQLIELVGLTRYVAIEAGILSYGQKKLVALAAALMPKPKLVVLDEPVAGVNPSRIREVEDMLRQAQPGRRDLPDRRAQRRVHHQSLRQCHRASIRAASWPRHRPPGAQDRPRAGSLSRACAARCEAGAMSDELAEARTDRASPRDMATNADRARFLHAACGRQHHHADRRQRRRQVDLAARDLRHQPVVLRADRFSAAKPSSTLTRGIGSRAASASSRRAAAISRG